MSNTIDVKEIEKFSKIADEWWSATGKFKPLHKFNPCRISYIKGQLIKHFDVNVNEVDADCFSLSNLKILDVGCGGGLLCEPFSRLGANVVGIDAGVENINIAKNNNPMTINKPNNTPYTTPLLTITLISINLNRVIAYKILKPKSTEAGAEYIT